MSLARLRVKRAKRLVHQQHLRPYRQRTGNGETLLHAPGKRVRICVFESVEPHRLNQGAPQCRAARWPACP